MILVQWPFVERWFYYGMVCLDRFTVAIMLLTCYSLRKKRKAEGFEDGGEKMTLGDQIREFLQNLRYFRIFIALWNILVICCMFM